MSLIHELRLNYSASAVSLALITPFISLYTIYASAALVLGSTVGHPKFPVHDIIYSVPIPEAFDCLVESASEHIEHFVRIKVTGREASRRVNNVAAVSHQPER